MRYRLASVVAAAALALTSPALAASISVPDASLKGNTLTLDVNASPGGWVVVHEVKNGAPGEQIGHANVKAGDNKNVQVKLAGQVTRGEDFFVMLHEDTGKKGTYEFKPGGTNDEPVMENGKPVMKLIGPKQ